MSMNLEKYSEAGEEIDLTRKACKCPFATLLFCYPLLEAGTELRYIQELLDHPSSRTTEHFTRMSATIPSGAL
ncbi:hypothetical protein [Paenibacillus sp. OSY-SE]|uniref:hypothetical protein n=1 Tax=Paenibacillus sp. OSY-SE TaxID=1196323 RepID=UPI0002DAEE60|nr:hypothetical protein [Paenibacillus sp. OSY-SE]